MISLLKNAFDSLFTILLAELFFCTVNFPLLDNRTNLRHELFQTEIPFRVVAAIACCDNVLR